MIFVEERKSISIFFNYNFFSLQLKIYNFIKLFKKLEQLILNKNPNNSDKQEKKGPSGPSLFIYLFN